MPKNHIANPSKIVAIKGMKMPENCLCCDITVHISVTKDVVFVKCPKLNEIVNGNYYGRHPECPLVEIEAQD